MSARVTPAPMEEQNISFPTASSPVPSHVAPLPSPAPPTLRSAGSAFLRVLPWLELHVSGRRHKALLHLAPSAQHIVDDNCPFAQQDMFCLCVPDGGGGGGFLRASASLRSVRVTSSHARVLSQLDKQLQGERETERERNWPRAWRVHWQV